MSVIQQAKAAIARDGRGRDISNEPDADLAARYMRMGRRPCFIGIHAWHWINETLPLDMGERECLRCGKRQVISMDAH